MVSPFSGESQQLKKQRVMERIKAWERTRLAYCDWRPSRSPGKCNALSAPSFWESLPRTAREDACTPRNCLRGVLRCRKLGPR